MSIEALIAAQIKEGEPIDRAFINLKKKAGQKSKGTIKAYLDSLDAKWSKISNRHEDILSLKEPKHNQVPYFSDNYYEEIEGIYLIEKGKFLDALDALEQLLPAPTPAPVVGDPGRNTTRKLPVISLPTFSGKHQDWPSFKDYFTSLVRSNTDLSAVEKLHYLKSSVSGDALNLIKNISVTADNYERAWNTLTSYFDNPRNLIRQCLDGLFQMKPLTTESQTGLKRLRDGTNEAIETLQVLNRPVDGMGDILVHMTVQRLDPTTRRDWELSLGDSTDPIIWAQLNTFLKNRVQALERAESKEPASAAAYKKPSVTPYKLNSHFTSKQKSNCQLCRKDHALNQCDKFKSDTIVNRRKFITDNHLCFNCLRTHSVNNCRSPFSCSVCSKRHHTLLHQSATPVSTTPSPTLAGNLPAEPVTNKSCASSTSHTANATSSKQHILLATAQLTLHTDAQQTFTVRALIDPCSEASFITEDLAQRMRLSRQSIFVPITGVGAAPSYTARSSATVKFTSHFNTDKSWNAQMLILPRLTEYLPAPHLVTSDLPFTQGLCLADPDLNSRHKIEVILGADIFPSIIQQGLRQSVDGSLIAQSTGLGWIITGSTSTSMILPAISSLQCICDTSLSNSIERFWVQEETSQPTTTLTADEVECEKHFLHSHKRDNTGRYILRLPVKANLLQLGNSFPFAQRMFHRTERKFNQTPQLKTKYVQFMDDYQTMGHMIPAPNTCSPRQEFFLPHHGIFKAHGDTHKLRVVFDGSAKLPDGLAINDCLHAGPKLQLDTFDVLLRWRKYPIVFTADIKQMFRQIQISEEDHPLQQILWRSSEDEPLLPYHLTTVTYGLASSPYQALRTLLQLASDEELKYPRAAAIQRENRYVDDFLVGANSTTEAKELKRELIQFLMAGGFPLSKWTSNDEDVLMDVSPADKESVNFKEWKDDDASFLRTLGVQWHPHSDSFSFSLDLELNQEKITTKRSALSFISQLYDPLGWISPIVVLFKIFMQSLWHSGLQWDDALPAHLQDKWTALIGHLRDLHRFSIPRWLGFSSDITVTELHGFSDASERAYAACLYLRTIRPPGSVNSILITSKTKLAPIKQVSLPRLELCGALILARLTQRVQTVLSMQTVDCHLWSDSTITLAWLRESPTTWKTYVANRVSEIQTTLPKAAWHHVSSSNNPADLASRGVTPVELSSSSLWLQGPRFLLDVSEPWTSTEQTHNVDCPEKRTKNCLATHTIKQPPAEPELLLRYSSLGKLLRITAWCLHYIHQLKNMNNENFNRNPPISPLTPMQLDNALKHWIGQVQTLHFASEIRNLSRGESVSPKSPLIPFNPFSDNQGIIRIGGRLKNSLLHPDEKNPIILPRQSFLTQLILRDAHERTLHGGTQLMLQFIRQRFWIIRGRQLVKSFLSRCLRCWKQKTAPATQLMADLPFKRIQPFRPFLNTGVDYAGPISMRLSKGRGTKSFKGYIAVFVCLSTRAVHLEAVSGYSTEDFISAFRRFISRRGPCASLTSDCGTNFVGANKELQALFSKAIEQSDKLARLLAEDGTEWRFNPPAAPHFGGIWEAAVKSVKHHLTRVVGTTLLTFEELSTLLAQIEACLNSRPLCPLSDDPSDLSALTPGHFLIGAPTIAVPEPSLHELPESRLDRWQFIQRLHQHFWTRWSTEYLHGLQQRPKWRVKLPPVKIGDLCLLRMTPLPPCKWPLARVLEVINGPDELPRVVRLKTATTELLRPISKLSLLPEQEEDYSPMVGEGGRNVRD